MMSYPLNFTVTATAEEAHTLKSWRAQVEHLPELVCAIPKEFQGSGEGYSPEDFFSLAVLNCLIATYKVYAQMTRQSFEKIVAKAVLTIDRAEKQPPAITHLQIYFNVYKPSDPEKAHKLFEDAKRGCMISNAIHVEKSFSFELL